MTASASDDGKLEKVLANLGVISVPFPVDLTGFYFSKPTSLIDLTGATVTGAEITLAASAAAPINPESACFKGSTAPACMSNPLLRSS